MSGTFSLLFLQLRLINSGPWKGPDLFPRPGNTHSKEKVGKHGIPCATSHAGGKRSLIWDLRRGILLLDSNGEGQSMPWKTSHGQQLS